MSKYKSVYISKDEYETKKSKNELYEGFVIGVGYAYYHAGTSYYQQGCLYSIPVGSQFVVNIPIVTYKQCIDTTPEMVVMSYGVVLQVPYDDSTFEYTVKPGDTLSAIAFSFKSSIDTIVQMNNMKDTNKVFPGQKLMIRFDKNKLSIPPTIRSIAYLKTINDKDALDPATVGRNWFGSYVGPLNPMTYGKAWCYATPAIYANDYPAIRHDRFYDIKKVKGIKGMLSSAEVIGADYRFVYEELAIAFGAGYTFNERIVGAVSATAIGTMSLPKTAWHFATKRPGLGLFEIIVQFVASGKVSDQPDNTNTNNDEN